ncbi:MAG: YeeE/YedE family protein [Halobacteriovoraceae bacterium]|nr:YeeE/YedE family protein [Halobacteriovoraceae bacterium]|tara:strand:+ start:6218 stop:6622 length:405 start_codon:yes stop_codon:yes gene_type:complete
MVIALVGGVIIGLSATLLLLLNGRIFGVTGIVAGLFNRPGPDLIWRSAIVLGLVLGSWLLSYVAPELFIYEFKTPLPVMALAGFLVGFGTRLGSGCTSGHGVCGLPRLSLRSMAATGVFMGFGILTVYLARMFS